MNLTKRMINRIMKKSNGKKISEIVRQPSSSSHQQSLSHSFKRFISHPSYIRNTNLNGNKSMIQAAAGGVVLLCGGALYFVDSEGSKHNAHYNSLSTIGRNSSSNRRNIQNKTLAINYSYNKNEISTTTSGRIRSKKIGRYTFGKTVGQGSFGVVRSATDLDTGKTYAVKEIDLNLVNIATVKEEVDILKHLGNDHQGICSLRDVIEKNNKVYLVFDFVKGVAFDSWVSENGVLSESAARQTAREMLNALKYVHERGVIHRDVKPENILVKREQLRNKDDPRFVLIDFGMAVKCEIRRNNNVVVKPNPDDAEGTFAFWAPEMMKRESYGPAVDLWALGVSLYCIMCGCHPFDIDGKHLHEEIYRDVISGNFDEENIIWNRELSKEGKDFISRLLNADSLQRMSCEEALQHPWLK